MLRRHTNALLQAILAAGLDPALFKGEDHEEDARHPGFSIRLKESPLYFIARNHEGSFEEFDYQFTEFAAGYPWTSPRPVKGYVSFDKLLSVFQEWLDRDVTPHLADVSLPDLWTQVNQVHLMLAQHDVAPLHEQFSTDERDAIRIAMQQFKLLIEKEFKPSDAEMQVVQEQLDHLVDGVNRLSKFDWQGVALNTLISVGVTLSLDTEKGRVLFGLFQQAFGYVLHLLR